MQQSWHILIVEDDKDIHRMLDDNLQISGFEVDGVYDAKSALDFIEREGLPHLAIIDIRLPGNMDGIALAKEITQRSVPVIIITAFDSPKTVLDSLSFADDYIRKPFKSVDEVTARVRRVLSRISDFSYARSPLLDVDERVQFDYTNNALVIEGQDTKLTPIESRLLHTLMQHRGNVVDGRSLIARVWSSDNIYEDTLRVHIHRLRSKLEVDPRHPKYIITERGIGYSFAA